MPKILYIEDELTRNIATIRKFFEPVLKDKSIQKALKELESSDRPFPEDIVEACSPSSELDIAYTFPRALELVIVNHKSYDLVIVDRNLSLYQYVDELERMKDMLCGIGQEFDEDRILEFHEREGDLILQVLVKLDATYKDKVYYLTANTSDALRGSPQLQTLIDVDSFKRDHIIEKGSPREKLVSDILSDMKAFRIQNRYRNQCDILRKRLTEDDVSQFVEMIKDYEGDKRKEFVFYLRNLLDNLLHSIAFKMGEMDAEYWNTKGRRKQLQIGPFIKGFIPVEQTEFVGLDAYDRKHDIGYSSIIRYACISIFAISSDCGVHEHSKAVNIESLNSAGLTTYTLASLMNQVCDVILWYDKAMDIISKVRGTNGTPEVDNR